MSRVQFRLGTEEIGRADLRHVRPQDQRRRHAAAIGYAAGGNHRNGDGVDNLRQQGEQSRLRGDVPGQEHAAMATGLRTLANDCVNTLFF